VHPVLTIGSWHVHSWGLLNALACVVVLLGALAGARFRALSPLGMLRLWPWAILGGVLGAHLYWLLAGGDATASSSDAVDVFRGSAVQGGFVGGGLATLAYLRLTGTPVLAALDVLAPAGAAAQAVTRVGCFLAGCCWGRRAPSWLGVVYDDPAALAPRGVPLHAAQLYECALLALLAAALAARLSRRAGADGRVFAAYLAGYGVIRFVVQFFRGDDADRLVGGLAHSQYAALVMIGAAWIVGRRVGARPARA
jgi:phosphatidylglycerol:prolipoprotein diacylglycerol transferase